MSTSLEEARSAVATIEALASSSTLPSGCAQKLDEILTLAKEASRLLGSEVAERKLVASLVGPPVVAGESSVRRAITIPATPPPPSDLTAPDESSAATKEVVGRLITKLEDKAWAAGHEAGKRTGAESERERFEAAVRAEAQLSQAQYAGRVLLEELDDSGIQDEDVSRAATALHSALWPGQPRKTERLSFTVDVPSPEELEAQRRVDAIEDVLADCLRRWPTFCFSHAYGATGSILIIACWSDHGDHPCELQLEVPAPATDLAVQAGELSILKTALFQDELRKVHHG